MHLNTDEANPDYYLCTIRFIIYTSIRLIIYTPSAVKNVKYIPALDGHAFAESPRALPVPASPRRPAYPTDPGATWRDR